MELLAAKKRARKQNDMVDDSAEEVEEGDENASIESAAEDQLSSESDGDSLETRHNKQVARQKKEQREKQREEQQEKARVVTGRRRREIDDADVLEYEDEQGNRQRMTITELEAEEKEKSKEFIAPDNEEEDEEVPELRCGCKIGAYEHADECFCACRWCTGFVIQQAILDAWPKSKIN